MALAGRGVSRWRKRYAFRSVGRSLKLPLPGCDEAPKFRIVHSHAPEERTAHVPLAEPLLGLLDYSLPGTPGVKHLRRENSRAYPKNRGSGIYATKARRWALVGMSVQASGYSKVRAFLKQTQRRVCFNKYA